MNLNSPFVISVDSMAYALKWTDVVATIPTTNGIKVTMVYTLLGQRVCNVYHFTNGHAVTLAELQALATIMQTWENGQGKNLRSLGSFWVGCYTKGLDAPGSPVWDLIPVTFLAGTTGGGALASFVTLAVRHTTGLSGRSYRGRSYVCGLSTGSTATADTVTAGFANLCTTVYTNLRTSALTGGFTFVVNSLYSGVDGSGKAIPRSNGKMTPIIASEGGIYLDTQRHRKVQGVV